jgi:hypothetical protein
LRSRRNTNGPKAGNGGGACRKAARSLYGCQDTATDEKDYPDTIRTKKKKKKLSNLINMNMVNIHQTYRNKKEE